MIELKPPFEFGNLVATPGALVAFAETGEDIITYVRRHVGQDWGEVCEEDWATNDYALAVGNRLVSAYTLSDGAKIWIITESDRSVTTVLLPEEY